MKKILSGTIILFVLLFSVNAGKLSADNITVKLSLNNAKKASYLVGDTVSVNFPGISANQIECKGKAGYYNKATGEMVLTGKGSLKLFTLNGNKKQNLSTIKVIEPKLKKKLSLKTGVSKTLKLSKVTPQMGEQVWISSDENIAEVKQGVVKGVNPGTATVTVYVNGHPASCTVVVKGEKNSDEKKSSSSSSANTDGSSGFTEADMDDIRTEELNLINLKRSDAGVPQLLQNAVLNQAAQIRANEIKIKFDHVRPNGDECFSAATDLGYEAFRIAENIAFGHNSVEDAVTAWMNSEGHRGNILNADYNEVGIGFFESDGVKYWVQIFGYNPNL